MSYAVKKDGSGWRRVNSPADCSADENFQALAPLPDSQSMRVLDIKTALVVIDQKKVRALTDSILSGDKTRLQALEDQAQALRNELAAL